MAMKKPPGMTPGGPIDAGRASDASMGKSFPNLVEQLTEDRWEDGTAREVATLLVLCEDGAWKACLSDRAMQRKAWVSAQSFMGLLGALETGLEGEGLAWRKAVPWTPQGGKRKPS